MRRAPADIARSAAESEAPWAWRNAVFMLSSYLHRELRNGVVVQPSGGVSKILSTPGAGYDLTPSGAGIQLALPHDIPIASPISVFLFFRYQQAPESDFNRLVDYPNGDRLACFNDSGSGTNDSYRWSRGGASGQFLSGEGTTQLSQGSLYSMLFAHEGNGGTATVYLNGDIDGQKVIDGSDLLAGDSVWLAVEGDDATDHVACELYAFYLTQALWGQREARDLHVDPFLPTRRRRILIPVSSGGGTSVAVSGTTAAASAGVGALALDLGLAATAPGQSATVGALDAQPALAGDNDALSSLSGAMDGQPGLVGDSDSAAGLSGSIDAQPALAGSAASVSALTGALSILGDLLLSGQVQAQSTASGTASLLMKLAGEAAGTSGEEAMLGLVQELGGEASAQSGLTGALALTAEFLLSGSIQATSGASGDLAMELGLSGSSAGVSDLLGAAWLDLALSGQTTAAAQLQAVLAGITDDVGYLTADAITIRAALDGKPELRAALDAAVTIKPH